MRVYLVRRESGEYSDHLSVVVGVFASEEAAVAHIESQESTYFEPDDYPGELWEPWYADGDGDEDERTNGRLVKRHPTRHPSGLRSKASDRRHDSWYVDGDLTSNSDTWFIDEYEVME